MLPFITDSVPAVTCLFRSQLEDFVVSEVPAYAPSGEGQHLFLWIRKWGLSTPRAAQAIEQALGLKRGDASWAGMKDAVGITEQFLCVPYRKELDPVLATLPQESEGTTSAGFSVRSFLRHGNKLKVGHLKGNHFRIVLRDVSDFGAAEEVLRILEQKGFANYFGPQRFGPRGDNPEEAKRLILEKDFGRGLPRHKISLLVSSLQSLLFNEVLGNRIERGCLWQARLGDLLKKTETGGEFLCEDPGMDTPRVESLEVSPTGPMFGERMPPAAGDPAAWEGEVLASHGLRAESFSLSRKVGAGARRAMLVPLRELSLQRVGSDLHLAFFLPKGSYATAVLREVFKRD